MKKVELPLLPPIYSTYQYQGPGSAILVSNPSIRNWYLNQVMILCCTRKFLSGYTTPDLGVVDSGWNNNPYIDKIMFPMRFLDGHLNYVIRNLIDAGYYIYFSDIDDYYVKGKTWYKELHMRHDGAICGYNQEDKTYCLYSYDSNWVYRKFWTPQKSFHMARKSMFKKGIFGNIWGIKPKLTQISFSADISLGKISEYLDSDLEKYPESEEGNIYGIVVHDYIAKYLDRLYDGSIPYERMDRRIFRLIWEHKKAMLERIQCIEYALKLGEELSKRYEAVVGQADTMRMVYASHHKKRRDSVLPILKNKLIDIKDNEQKILTELIERARGIKNK